MPKNKQNHKPPIFANPEKQLVDALRTFSSKVFWEREGGQCSKCTERFYVYCRRHIDHSIILCIGGLDALKNFTVHCTTDIRPVDRLTSSLHVEEPRSQVATKLLKIVFWSYSIGLQLFGIPFSVFTSQGVFKQVVYPDTLVVACSFHQFTSSWSGCRSTYDLEIYIS